MIDCLSATSSCPSVLPSLTSLCLLQLGTHSLHHLSSADIRLKLCNALAAMTNEVSALIHHDVRLRAVEKLVESIGVDCNARVRVRMIDNLIPPMCMME